MNCTLNEKERICNARCEWCGFAAGEIAYRKKLIAEKGLTEIDGLYRLVVTHGENE